MNFNQHYNLIGEHAFLSASKYHWINYDEEKLANSYLKWQAVQMGTRLHALAAEHIALGIKMPKTKKTLDMFVNDAIGFKMVPEQVLFYSENCFGTADAISFNERQKKLRVHDYKSGSTPTSMHQLEIYDALFCLEYGISPADIEIENRIYQLDEVRIDIPDPEWIREVMNKIILFDQRIEKLKMEE